MKRLSQPRLVTPLLLACVLFIQGCAPGFVLRAAYEQSKILLGREKISKIIANPKETEETKEKLKLVLNARDFAISLGLTPKGSFLSYSRVDKEALVWVVAGCKPTKFQLYTWWFPIVGSVPYKGYFDKTDAEKEEQRLQSKGYETFVRGADALSTLGWFDDPVLTTLIRHEDDWIVNTVIHESVHSTVWIKNNVPFNESLANFVGFQGATEFYKKTGNKEKERIALKRLSIEKNLGSFIEKLYSELNELYESSAPESIKAELRHKIFKKSVGANKKILSKLKILTTLNNAEIMQLKFYLTAFGDFKKLYEISGQSWSSFFESIKAISNEIENDSSLDPFELLKNHISKVDNTH